MDKIFLIQALAELAYSVAMLDGKLEKEERKTFYRMVDSELREDAWMAKNKFFLLEREKKIDVEKSIIRAISIVKRNQKKFNSELKAKFNKILNGIAANRPKELEVVNRFNLELAVCNC